MRPQAGALELGELLLAHVDRLVGHHGVGQQHHGQRPARPLPRRRLGDREVDALDAGQVLLVQVEDDDHQVRQVDRAHRAQVGEPRPRVDQHVFVGQLAGAQPHPQVVEKGRSGSGLGSEELPHGTPANLAGYCSSSFPGSRKSRRPPEAARSAGNEKGRIAFFRDSSGKVKPLAWNSRSRSRVPSRRPSSTSARAGISAARGLEIEVPHQHRGAAGGQLDGGLQEGEAASDAAFEGVEGDDHRLGGML